MRLRAYAAEDFGRLYTLDQACFAPGIAYSKAELRGFLDSPSTFTAVALADAPENEASERIVGFAIVRNVRMAGSAALHIITIDVDPAARRQGTGRQLMRWMEERARALGSSSMRLEVAEDNLEAQRFYAVHGFRVTGRIEAYYAPLLDALVMERALDR